MPPIYSASEPWLNLDLGLDAGLLGGVVKDIRGFVSNVVHFVLDPLGRARDLGPSVNYGLILKYVVGVDIGHAPSKKWKGRK
jgi:hypothetical protein